VIALVRRVVAASLCSPRQRDPPSESDVCVCVCAVLLVSVLTQSLGRVIPPMHTYMDCAHEVHPEFHAFTVTHAKRYASCREHAHRQIEAHMSRVCAIVCDRVYRLLLVFQQQGVCDALERRCEQHAHRCVEPIR
jgi:hypothetical protein